MAKKETQNTTPNAAKPEGEEAQTKRRRRGGDEGSAGGASKGGPSKDGDGSEVIEKLVAINRVAKVVKGGKRFGFAALVVVGDGKGKVGLGSAKAREVPDAVKKATEMAKRRMVRIPLREGRTLHHDIVGCFGAGQVVLRSAAPGTGIIAGGPMRAIFEALGMQDIVAKSVGTSNPHNMIKATLAALQQSGSPRHVAARRGKKVNEIIGKKADAADKEKKDQAA
jgi:small subunit ribosomal protein S5